MPTVTVGRSPGAVPAAPWRVGSWLLELDPFAGCVRVTSGGVVSLGAVIVKVLGLLVPVLPALSVWRAWAEIGRASCRVGVWVSVVAGLWGEVGCWVGVP